MKRMIVAALCCAIGMAAVRTVTALDVVQNDFWNTTAYENAQPAVQTNGVAQPLAVSGVQPAYSSPLQLFDSRPPKSLKIFFR